MYIEVPDQFPGRCRNHRWYVTGMERCLDYEGTAHVCSFREPGMEQYTWAPKSGTITTTWTHRQPEQWVKPGDENDARER